jgi:hypothetical protein
MDNPVTIIKSNLTVGKIIGFAIAGVALLALLDLAGLTPWFLFPVTTARNKFGKKNA